jgi:large subunit ribosomal protein L25
MAGSKSTALTITPREPSGSRAARRLRRAGDVPGVLYGGEDEPVSFQVSARTLRHALQTAGAVLDLTIEGGGASPAVVKELIRHPLTGDMVHIDLLRVRLDVKIQATVALELTGSEDAPGVKLGGVLEHMVRELTIEALPTDIPDSITHDVSALEIGETVTISQIKAPADVELLDDGEIVVATLSAPRLQAEAADEIETETEVVGEGEAEAEAAAGEEEAADAADDSAAE